jgi:hypothetical protein
MYIIYYIPMLEIRGLLTRLAARLPSGATALGVGASLDGAPEWHPVTSLQLPVVPNLEFCGRTWSKVE